MFEADPTAAKQGEYSMGIYIGTAGNDNPGDLSFYEWIYGLDGNDVLFSTYSGAVITIFEGGRGDDLMGLAWVVCHEYAGPHGDAQLFER